MKNGQRDFQRTEAMKSDTVIGEAMEELCDSRHLPKQIPGVEQTQLSLLDGEHKVTGIKLSTGEDSFSWREGGKDGVQLLHHVMLCPM